MTRIYLTASALLVSLALQAQRPELFVLSVGIETYQDSRLNLNYAADDARDLAAAWQSQTDLYQVMEVKTLTNTEATRERIRTELDAFKKKVTGNDLFVFIFSGHGMEDGLVPYDYNANDSEGTTVSKNTLKTKLAALGCNYMVFLDACHSGSFAKSVLGDKDVFDDGAFALSVEQASRRLAEELSSADKNTFIVSSSASDQKSFECASCKHGYFAQVMLDCLDGKKLSDPYTKRSISPLADGNGFLSALAFENYLTEAVRIKTLDLATPQKVRVMRSTGSDFPILRIKKDIGVSTTTTIPRSTDKDGDDLADPQDECPDEYGTAAAKGCPDYDEDGIPNHRDNCLFEAGTAANDGCPIFAPADSDSDGVPDAADKCKYTKGLKKYEGCPDTDGDLVPDHLDNCPNEKGDPANNGCIKKTTTKPDLPNFVLVDGGNFTMGSKDGSDETPHAATVSDFYMGRYEVTFDEYDAYCAATGTTEPGDRGWGRGKRPAINVSWNDAVAYCNWRSGQDGLQKVYTISGSSVTADWNANGYRLPTEAEWEFAARSRGKDEKWAGTSAESSLSSYANISGSSDGYEHTAPVGTFKANALGLHDMSGNVWEWCWDWYGTYPSEPKPDYKGLASGSLRVVRGRSWVNVADACRTANRGFDYPDRRYNYLGFRLVLVP